MIKHRVYSYDSYVKSTSITNVQRKYRRNFKTHGNMSILTRNTILYLGEITS